MKEYNNKSILKRLIHLALKDKIMFVGCIVVALILAFLGGFRPKYIGNHVIDEVIKNLQSPHSELYYQELIFACLVLLGLVLAETVLSFFLSYYSNVIAQKVIKDLRVNLFDKLVQFKSAYFDKTPIGTLVTRSVSDIETIATVYNDGIMLFLGDILRIFVVLGFMFAASVKLTLFALIIFPLMFVVTRIFQKAIKKTFSNERTFTSEMNSFVQERLSGISLIQVFNRQIKETENFSGHNQNLLQANLKTVFYFSLFFPVVEVISAIAVGLIIYFGGIQMIENQSISIGTIVTFIVFYIPMLVRPLRQIADRFNTIQRGIVGAERVVKIIDNEEVIENKGTLQTPIQGNIEFQKVDFSYIKEEKVLHELTFSVQKGQKIAVVGATGAGKSTIINLLSRFYEYNSGKITIDGIDIRAYELNYLREQVGVVLQDVFLFNDTLYNNIILGNHTISKEQVQKAAQEIGIDSFIQSLPHTYDYMVSERGNSLSVGQRQLISFLRAYVYNPTILVLDEATSSIDTLSEELIQTATDKLTQNRTSIIIAHRLATIQNADIIMVLEQGRLVEKGSHEELMKLEKQYFKLYQAQFNQMNLDS